MCRVAWSSHCLHLVCLLAALTVFIKSRNLWYSKTPCQARRWCISFARPLISAPSPLHQAASCSRSCQRKASLHSQLRRASTSSKHTFPAQARWPQLPLFCGLSQIRATFWRSLVAGNGQGRSCKWWMPLSKDRLRGLFQLAPRFLRVPASGSPTKNPMLVRSSPSLSLRYRRDEVQYLVPPCLRHSHGR